MWRRALPHLLGFVIPVLVLLSARLGGAWTFLTVGVLYGLVPVADHWSGLATANPPQRDVAALEDTLAFRLITWIWAPIQLGLIAWGLFTVTADTTSTVEGFGLTVSIGLTCGAIGITFAHELIHRPGRWERALGEVLLASVSYAHFAIEHVHGHHRWVATPRDPATARRGESVYRFYPRTVAGGLVGAWRLERRRLGRRGRPWWHRSNRLLRYGAEQFFLYTAVAWYFGLRGIAYLAAQAVVAFTLLEIINYIEHYGLERRQLAPGRYERVSPWHSWNSSHRLSNWILINLARHADHHSLAGKRYQVLDHVESAPQLPAGYGTMFLVALVPPVWHRLMDRRVEEWRRSHLPTNLDVPSSARHGM